MRKEHVVRTIMSKRHWKRWPIALKSEARVWMVQTLLLKPWNWDGLQMGAAGTFCVLLAVDTPAATKPAL